MKRKLKLIIILLVNEAKVVPDANMVPTRGNVTHARTLHAGATTPTRVPAMENGVSRV